MGFQAREATIRNIFVNGDYEQFGIPVYQRSYVWGQDELDNYWNDFVLGDTQTQLRLLGSIIISKSRTDSKKYGVVDGQQRLITTSVFIAALRDVWGKHFGQDNDYHNLQRYIVGSDRSKGTIQKIKVSETLKDAYDSLVVLQKMPDSTKSVDEKAVVDAYKFFAERLERVFDTPKITQDYAKDLLWKKIEKLFDASVIIVTLDDEDDAYEVFEGFNARGVELSIADLFKNLILQKVNGTPEEKMDAASKWAEINQIIKEIGIPKFNINTYLRYFWIKDHQYIGEKELYKRIKKDTKNYRELLSKLYVTAQNLGALFSDNKSEVQELIGGDIKYSAAVCRSLRALRVMNTQNYIVWLMALTDERTREYISPKWLRSTLHEVEVFSFRYFGVSKLPANRVEKLYAKMARNLLEAVDNKDEKIVQTQVLNKFHQQVITDKLLPSDEQFLLDFSNIALQSNNKPFIRYLLSTLEESRTTAEKIIDQQAVNIEHILPQKTSSNWKISISDFKTSVNRLGNLTILLEKLNSSMSNKPINQKIEILKNSEITLNDDVVSSVKISNNWGLVEIAERQTALAEEANKVWAL